MSLMTLIESRTAVDRRALLAILLVGIILLGGVLRFLELGAESYWLDEVKMLNVAGSNWDVITRQTLNGRPPVFVVLAHFWMQLFGTSEAVTRALPALAGILSLPLMYLIGRDLFGQEVGLIATFLMAISEFQIAQAQNFRYYSVFLVFALLSFLAWWRALHTGKLGYFALYVLSSLAMFYSHTHGIFVVAAQGLYFVLRAFRYRPVWLKWLASQVLILLGLLPGMNIAFGNAVDGSSNVFQWIRDPQWWQPILTFMRFVFPGRHYPAVLTVAGALIFALVALVLFVRWKGKDAWLASVRDLGPTTRALSTKGPELLLIACWLVITIIAPLLLSYVFGPMYLDRYVIGASPALYLLIALVIYTIRKVIPTLIPLGMLVILITPGLYEYYVIPTKEQWRETSNYLQARVEPGDRFIFAPSEGGAIEESLRWYYPVETPGCGIEAGELDAADIAAQVPPCIGNAERFWLILRGYEERVQPFRNFFVADTPPNMTLVDQHHLKDIDVYLFDIAR